MPKTYWHEMPAGNPSVRADDPLAPSREGTPIAVSERRETERAITDWEEERRRLGHQLALMTLNVSEMAGEKWAYRFIIAVDPVVEYCALLFCGSKFAAMMGLPEKPDHSVPMVQQLPPRYVPVFTKGCVEVMMRRAPVRMQGAVDREDGQQELYRAAFIPLSIKSDWKQWLAFGAFNCRLVDCGMTR